MNPRRIEPTQMSQDDLPTVAATAPMENNTRGGTPLATQKAPVQSMPRRSDAASAAACPAVVAPLAATPPALPAALATATPARPPTAASPTIEPRSLSAAALTVLVPSV